MSENSSTPAYNDLCPQGCVPMVGLRILSFIDPEGSTRYTFRFAGSGQVTEVIGLLEMVKAGLVEQGLKLGRWEDTEE